MKVLGKKRVIRMRTELAFSKSNGARTSIQLDNLFNIDLSNMDIQTVSLMPLVSESGVRSIGFQNNPLKEIDLSPLVMMKEVALSSITLLE